MKIEKKFNMFQILEKDDKELVHSAFIKFLIEEYPQILSDFFKVKSSKIFTQFKLEKTHLLPKNDESKRRKKCCIDLEIVSLDGSEVLVIENKFKAIPSRKQLEIVDRVYENESFQKVHKILLTFDPKTEEFQNDWRLFSYTNLIHFLPAIIEQALGEKKIFIEHYYYSLAEKVEIYHSLEKNCSKIFEKDYPNRNFWLNIIYSSLRKKIEISLGEENFIFQLSPGNARTSLLNIIPKSWQLKRTRMETLIQFHGDKIKFYSHSNHPDFIKILKKKLEKSTSFDKGKFKFKTSVNPKENSRYLIQISVWDAIDSERFQVNNISDFIRTFYEVINNDIMVPSATELKHLDHSLA